VLHTAPIPLQSRAEACVKVPLPDLLKASRLTARALRAAAFAHEEVGCLPRPAIVAVDRYAWLARVRECFFAARRALLTRRFNPVPICRCAVRDCVPRVSRAGMDGSENLKGRHEKRDIDAGDLVPGVLYLVLFLIACWRLYVHRLKRCDHFEPKFGFHLFVMLFGVRWLCCTAPPPRAGG
jgi:hypothetical protein